MIPSSYPGQALGLPPDGAGSVASLGVRGVAFAIDVVISALVALFFTRPALPQNWSLVAWAILTVFGVGVFGSTPGQAAVGIRVAPLGGRSLVGLWAIPRTALVFLLVPVLLTDVNTRGVHDRLFRTVVIRTR